MSITNKLNTCALARLIQLGKMNISDSQIDFKVWYFKTRWRLLGKWFLSFRSMSRIDENLRREGLTSLSLSQFTTNLRWSMTNADKWLLLPGSIHSWFHQWCQGTQSLPYQPVNYVKYQGGLRPTSTSYSDRAFLYPYILFKWPPEINSNESSNIADSNHNYDYLSSE